VIITGQHPDAKKIHVYNRYGHLISKILEIDTHKMIAKISSDNGVEVVKVYKIKGPGIYFKRKPLSSRTINTRKK